MPVEVPVYASEVNFVRKLSVHSYRCSLNLRYKLKTRLFVHHILLFGQ